MSLDDESYLEIDAAEAPHDPTPGLRLAGDDDAFLEVAEPSPTTPFAQGRVVTDDDLRMVTALADDAAPLLAALWPARGDLLVELPSLEALRARVALARTTLNRVTRRGAEWRARAEVAGAALTRRLEALGGGGALDEARLRAAGDELRAWHERALAELLRAEAAGRGRVYADGARRVRDEAQRRGLDDVACARVAARVGVELLAGDVAPWTPCTVLPGEPRTLDEVATALVQAPSQGLAALRDGSLARWLRANRCPDALGDAAREAQRLAEAEDPAALWWLAWALGRDGVTVDGHAVTAPETLLAHLRTARLHLSGVAAMGAVLGRWFRLRGHAAVALACEGLARGEPHAGERLRWALGEPLRLGERTVLDPAGLVRDVLTRPGARAAALGAWREGTLRAWLDTLPRTLRDALWLDELARAPAHDHDEGPFWRGVYRRAPKAALRVALDDREGRSARFHTVADLHATARVAALWEPLKGLLRTGELRAWLAAAAPGVELDAVGRGPDDDVALHEMLAAVGHTGLVLPWGRAGVAVTAPADLVAAWRRGWQQVEAVLARGHVGAWLARHHPGEGIAGVTAERAVAAWGTTLGAGSAPPGVAALRLALLCGLDELPVEPARPMVRGVVRGYRAVDRAGRDPGSWEPLLAAVSPHRAHGTVILWLARHVPACGALALDALDPARAEGCLAAIAAAGSPVPTELLATEHVVAERESARLAAEREAARLAAEREAAALDAAGEAQRLAAERESLRLSEAREALRRELDRELDRLTAERDAARATLAQESARLEAERALARLEGERAVAEARAACDAAVREAERALAGVIRERDEARAEGERAIARAQADRDAAVREAERARLERDLAKLEAERSTRRAERIRESLDQEAAEREAERLQALEAERRATLDEERRLRALEAACRDEAAREAARMEALAEEAREAARMEAARMEALAEEARRRAVEERSRLAALAEEARREAARRAEEAAALALRLADEARRREAAEREAEELSRRLQREREVAREAGWAARRVAAEREVERLAEAERRARALAAELTVPEAPEPFGDAVAEALAEIEGALDDSPAEREQGLDDSPWGGGLAERREIRAEALFEAQPLTEGALGRVRAAVVQWARASGRTTDHGEAVAVEILEAVTRPAFEVHVTTRMEARTLSFVRPPWREDDVVAVPTEATAPGAAVDPWALGLPELDVWTSWRGEFLLDAAPIKTPCAGCEAGLAPCPKCDGAGDRPCGACEGRTRVRCPRCAGAGEVAGPSGAVKCEACAGRRELRCPACAAGRAACPACRGSRRSRCPACGGAGEHVERVAVTQEYRGVAAVSVVGPGVPAAVLAGVQSREADPLPVVHVEAATLDAFALARELPHAALGEAVAQSLADEAARAEDPWRLTRQRLVVRRYPAAEVRCTVAGEAYTLWVHGLRDAVFAASSPRSRRAEALVGAAAEAIAREDVGAAVDALRTLQELAPDDAQAERAAGDLGALVLTMARRGELFAAREAAARARPLRWAACVDRLVEAERELGSRLQVRAPWALAEEARAALAKGRDDRCIERLQQLAAVEPDHPEGSQVAAGLGARLADVARERLAQGELAAAATVVARARAVPFTACGAAVAEVEVALGAALTSARRREVLPWAVAVLAIAVALAAVLWR